MEEGRVEKKQAGNIFGGAAGAFQRLGGDDLGKHFIAFDTMVKNAQGSDSKKCNW